MAGLYIHIPFCRQACTYCNFHFSTQLDSKSNLIDAIAKEISLRKDYCSTNKIKTIYFGGGTPSLLDSSELEILNQAFQSHFDLSELEEMTIELNPEDVSLEKVRLWKDIGFNRISLGVQSFIDQDLLFMNRAHNASQSKMAIEMLQAGGFENISIDLIYGTPDLSSQGWDQNLEHFFQYEIPHLSAYCLTVEPKTALEHQIRKGEVKALNDEIASQHFQILRSKMKEKGFQHYEISNFSLPGKESLHNTAYWKGHSYLGLGPGAHSFNGTSREWNISNNVRYLKALQKNELPSTLETLTLTDQFNEYLLTGFRTMYGCQLSDIRNRFGSEFTNLFLAEADRQIALGHVTKKEDTFYLNDSFRFVSDSIIAEFFAE